jgi:hypothetical protein
MLSHQIEANLFDAVGLLRTLSYQSMAKLAAAGSFRRGMDKISTAQNPDVFSAFVDNRRSSNFVHTQDICCLGHGTVCGNRDDVMRHGVGYFQTLQAIFG